MSSTKSPLNPSVIRKLNAFMQELSAFELPTRGRELDTQLTFAALHMRCAQGLRPGKVILVDSPLEAFDMFQARLSVEERLSVLKQSGTRFYSHYGQVLSKDVDRSWEHLKLVEARRLIEEKLSQLLMSEVARLSELEVKAQGRSEVPTQVRICQNTFYVETFLATFIDEAKSSVSLTEGCLRLLLMSPCVLLYRDDLIVSRPPVEILTDTLGRVHAEDKPAIRFTNGDCVGAIAGVHVDTSVFDSNKELDAHRVIDEENMEVRRVLMNRLGIDALLKQLDAVEEAVDDYGTLYRALPRQRNQHMHYHWHHNANDEIVFVKLLNATPEQDGSFKEYLLRVPPYVQTPRAAVAWSFQMDEATYAPVVQT
jgi:hypothetical protein